MPPPRFIDGRRHVLVTLGTHLQWVKQRMDADLSALAPQFPDVVFHFSAGDTALPPQPAQGNYHCLPYVDYAQHLHRYALVVHHGGAGILYACLAAGLPSIVYPLDYDQFDHAARLQAAGAAWWLRDLGGLPALLQQALNGDAVLPGVNRLQWNCRRSMRRHRFCSWWKPLRATGKCPRFSMVVNAEAVLHDSRSRTRRLQSARVSCQLAYVRPSQLGTACCIW